MKKREKEAEKRMKESINAITSRESTEPWNANAYNPKTAFVKVLFRRQLFIATGRPIGGIERQ